MDAADGTPYFLITRSGNVPDGVPSCPTGDSGAGNLIVVRMGSRDANGERLRSNRLRKGMHVNDTPPPPEDTALPFYSFAHGGLVFRDGDGGLPPRAYAHPGGMQLIGHVLAVAVEGRIEPPFGDYDVAPDPTLIMFFDVSAPENPQFLSQFPLVHPDGEAFQKAGVVAITPLPGGRYLMATTGGDGNEVHFFRSTIGDLTSPALSWEFVDKTAPEVDDDPQQTLQFLREGDINGDLYLAGVRGHPVFGSDHDKIDLYLVHGQTQNFEPGEEITQGIRRRGQLIATFPNTGGGRLANGAAASGFHINPSGELILYVTEHDNDGPDGTIKMGEWRHEDMVRSGSPTYLPTAVVGGPYEVDEGGSVDLIGAAMPPITKAWIQLFHETDFRSFYPVVDFADSDRDDFDDFATLEFLPRPPGLPLSHNHQARSWKWFAPVGCSIRAIDHENGGVRTLAGDGAPHFDPDLTQVLADDGASNMDQRVDAVEFIGDCGYSGLFTLRWDLDLDGIFETTGSPVSLHAINLDGPSAIHIPAQAQSVSGGPSGQAIAVVNVRNVAPVITSFSLVDPAGLAIGGVVSFALVNLEYSAQGTFVDPGRADHQSAILNFGDGPTIPHAEFDSFQDAFGGAEGQLSLRHVYQTPGTYQLNLEVTDDDSGQTSAATSMEVVSPAGALQAVVQQVDQFIASTTNQKVAQELGKARKALADRNGALDKLAEGKLKEAIGKMKDAVKHLEHAERERGGDLSGLKYLLAVTGESIAQGAYLDAVNRAGPSPTADQLRKLEEARQQINEGRAALVAQNYVDALEAFKQAVERAASIH